MNILYIGQYSVGSTSKMRGEQLKELINPISFNVVDTTIPFNSCAKIWRSIGFRYKHGPVIKAVNNFIKEFILNNKIIQYDLIWVDKGIYVTEETTKKLRSLTKLLVHFTPDPAFTFHKSMHFNKSLSYYDYAITTKTFEKNFYEKSLPQNKVLLTTQGFNSDTHYPQTPFKDKKEGVLFIGHFEKERALVIQHLLDANIPVTLAGIKWEKFVKNNLNKNLTFLGRGIYGAEYAKTLSDFQFSWGALSKWIPEKHTTRTFEIPACGTALITERNYELNSFFAEDEVIFYDSIEEMIKKIEYFQSNPAQLDVLTQRGLNRVNIDGRDYKTLLKGVLKQMRLL